MLPVSVVVEVNGLDSDVRVKGVFVKQDSTTSMMGNVEVIREALALKILNRFLNSNHVPFRRNVFFNGTFSAMLLLSIRWYFRSMSSLHDPDTDTESDTKIVRSPGDP